MEKSKKVTKSSKINTSKIKSKFFGLYYGHPANDMKLVCITGTTGKTEVANYVHEILKAAGQTTAMLTSNQPIKMGALHKFLSTAWKASANYVIITTPAESLKKDIFYGLPIHVAALTDFIPANLKSMSPEEYVEAETTLFRMNPEFVVLNRDDANYQTFSEFVGTKGTLTYGKDRYANINISSSKLYKKGAEADLAIGTSHFTVATFLTGEPVISYMAAATAIADALHITPEKIAEGIGNYESPASEEPVAPETPAEENSKIA